MLNNAPFYVRATERKKKGLILCLHSKSGSTTWKTLIFASIDPGNLESYENPHPASHVFRPNLMPMHGDDCNRKIPRITIVRNPYSRLLSCFKDKILSKNQTEIKGSRIAPDTYSIGGSFAEFVHATVNSTRLNPHLTLQTSHCNLQGSVYDYALHIEEIDVWFKPVLQMLGQDIHNPRFVEDGHIKALNFHGADETITEYYTQDLAETTPGVSPASWKHRTSLRHETSFMRQILCQSGVSKVCSIFSRRERVVDHQYFRVQ
eukprot:6213382-Pleurochrysis_carterae.AAC.2